MSICYKNIKKQFEKSMQSYDKNAVIQDMTATMLLEELCKISTDFENILELGSGTGLLTKKIASKLKFKNFFANDLVEKSKSYVEKYIPNSQFLHGNALKINPARKMDLIISNAMFQWFNNPNKAIETLKLSLSTGGILAFSTFSPENFKEIREVTGLTLDYKSQSELETILKNNGFEILYGKNFEQILEFNTPLELLAHMKHTGVNSLSDNIWTIKEVKSFCDNYSAKYAKTTLTYSPVIFICRIKK